MGGKRLACGVSSGGAFGRALALAFGLVLGLVPAGRAPAQAGAPCGSAGSASDLELLALTQNQRLLCLRESQADAFREIGPITGLMGNERLVGIDFRPADGQLYGLGSAGGLYQIDPATADAWRMGALNDVETGLPPALAGRPFGIDFDPVSDRLRVTGVRGQDFWVDVDTGQSMAAGPLARLEAGGAAQLSVVAVAFTNNDLDPATGSQIYGIDPMRNALGLLLPQVVGAAPLLTAIGDLGVVVAMDGGFDIFSEPLGGPTGVTRAVAVLPQGGPSRVFSVDLVTGRLAERSQLAGGGNRVIGIAIPLIQGAPPPAEGDPELGRSARPAPLTGG